MKMGSLLEITVFCRGRGGERKKEGDKLGSLDFCLCEGRC